MLRYISALALVLCVSVASADPATLPANLSPAGVARWAIVGGALGSGTGALPAVATAGARYTDISTPSAPIDYRSDGASWVAISGGVGSVSADLLAHIADQVDPHGATMTVTAELSIGSGTPDTSLARTHAGVLTIASYVALLPMDDPPAAFATGTLWLDATGTLYLYVGGSWVTLGGVIP
jgi:hypothetical protein